MGADSTFVTNDAWAGHPGEKIVVDRYFVSAGLDRADNQAGIGTFCHELGHVLGIADLADVDADNHGPSDGIGEWGLMGSGAWNTQTRPAHMTAWTKERLGWLFYIDVVNNGVLCLPPVETDPVAIRMWQHGVVGKQYFVVENRQPIGFDENIHGSGLVICYSHDSRYEEWTCQNRANVDETGQSLGVECADATTVEIVEDADDLNLGRCDGGNRCDAGDVRCPAIQTFFGPTSTPDSRSNNGVSTDVSISNISTRGGKGEDICADHSVGIAGPTLDLFMHERDGDDCAELTDCDTWWASPDLWIDNDGDGEGDIPVEGDRNLLWYRIKNVGFHVAVGAQLEVFDRESGFGLRWPEAGYELATVHLPLIGQSTYDGTIVGHVEITYPMALNDETHLLHRRPGHASSRSAEQPVPSHRQHPRSGQPQDLRRARGRRPRGGECRGRDRLRRLHEDVASPDPERRRVLRSPGRAPSGTAAELRRLDRPGGLEPRLRSGSVCPSPDEHRLDFRHDERGRGGSRRDGARAPHPVEHRERQGGRGSDPRLPRELRGARAHPEPDGEMSGRLRGQRHGPDRSPGLVYSYRLKEIDAAGTESDLSPVVLLDGDDSPGSAATEVEILADADGLRLVGRPNLFREGTTLSFRLPEAGSVSLRVFDVAGRLVATLVDEVLGAGRHDVA